VPVGALAGGWLGGRYGLRTVAVGGMLLAAVGFVGLQAWDGQPLELLRTVPLLVGGFGFGLVIAPLSAVVLQHVGEEERATAASWLTLSRVVGMLIGAALLTSSGLGRFYVRAGTIDFDSPEFDTLVLEAEVSTFREVFVVAAVAMVVAAAIAWWIGRGERDSDRKQWWMIT